MKDFLLFIWQLPQNIIGFFLSRSWVNRLYVTCHDKTTVLVYFTNNVFGAGISLGKYIILDNKNHFGNEITDTVSHEHGHQLQSIYLGWLYLPVVGLVSIFRNIWDRLFHKKWNSYKRYIWYYSGYPEAWADKLGKVPSRWW